MLQNETKAVCTGTRKITEHCENCSLVYFKLRMEATNFHDLKNRLDLLCSSKISVISVIFVNSLLLVMSISLTSTVHENYECLLMWLVQCTNFCLEDRVFVHVSLPVCLSLFVYCSLLSPSIYFWQQQQTTSLLSVHALQPHLVNQPKCHNFDFVHCSLSL